MKLKRQPDDDKPLILQQHFESDFFMTLFPALIVRFLGDAIALQVVLHDLDCVVHR
jgi:hypothetical protein